MKNTANESIEQLLKIMRKLRAPGGCPWDRQQTNESIKFDLIEEAYEALDAIENGHPEELQEELGDLLLQVVFHSHICSENGHFSFYDVANGVVDKLVRRHPHVFGNTEISGLDEVMENWDAIKKSEQCAKGKPPSALEGIPRKLPALHKTYQIWKRAKRAGFNREETIGRALEKLHEKIEEINTAVKHGENDRIAEKLGDLLFSAVNTGCLLGYHPEDVLRKKLHTFSGCFQRVEQRIHAAGRPLNQIPTHELDLFWKEVKHTEKER